MKKANGWLMIGISSLALVAMAVSGIGCSAPGGQTQAASKERASNGPQLWADNCVRCHNTRTPSMYSDAQWEVVSMHMRVRANITAQDSREILAFLKSAH